MEKIKKRLITSYGSQKMETKVLNEVEIVCEQFIYSFHEDLVKTIYCKTVYH
jgi:hypothetical protein